MLDRLKSTATQLVASSDDDVTEVMPGLSVFRKSQDCIFDGIVYQPLLCVVLRGRKEFQLKDKLVSVEPGEAFVISHDLPIPSKVSGASPEAPYLSLILSLDLGILRGLYDQIGPTLVEDTNANSLSKGPFQLDWAEPLDRYLGLAEKPKDTAVIGPLILKELHFKLLTSPIGGMLRNLLFVNSQASRISETIQYMKVRFREPIAVGELAKVASMSTSSFFDHFKTVTGTTPLQYQKNLRLIEARNLLLTGAWSVSSAGLEVGYESPSHFSRDYTRKYGRAPKHDLALARGRAERA